MKQFLFVKKG